MKRLFHFFGASAAGLTVDLVLFGLLTFLGVVPGLSNALSSTASISVVYLIATRRAFGQAPRLFTYLVFFSWYLASIATFSVLIQVASAETGSAPFLWKVLSVPVSFALNYAFSTFLFRRHGGTAER